MKYNIQIRIDSVFKSKAKEAIFRLSTETIDEAADIIKNLASDILSFPEKDVNKEDLKIKIPGEANRENRENLYYGDTINTVSWFGYKSDIGKVRELDEDSIVIITAEMDSGGNKSTSSLFVLGDGVGGHIKGEIASYLGTKTAAQELIHLMLSVPGKTEDEIENSVKNSIKKANKTIYDRIKDHPEYGGMATTLVVALIKDRKLYVGNVGDSRAYIINDEIRQITRDHSVVQEMVDAGKITKEEARTHPKKNVVTRVVGYYQDVDVDVFKKNISEKDTVLLCCDGLSDVVRDEEIKDIVKNQKNFSKASDELVSKANERGGPDNISVIIAHSNDKAGKNLIPETGEYPIPGRGKLETGKLSDIKPPKPPEHHIDFFKQVLPVILAVVVAISLVGTAYIYIYQSPKITNFAPNKLDFNSETGKPQNFSIGIDQKADVTWYINGTVVKPDPAVNTSFYNNTSTMPGSWNVTVIASNSKGTATKIWNWTVAKTSEILEKIIVSPPSETIHVGDNLTFKADTLDQSGKIMDAVVRWDSSNTGVGTIIPENGLFTAQAEGMTIVTASNGTVHENASVTVIPQTLKIIASSPSTTEVNTTVGNSTTFKIEANQKAYVTWSINESIIKTENNQTSILNQPFSTGVRTVTAVASNANGSDNKSWILNITSSHS